MDRREMLGLLGAGAAGVSVLAGSRAEAQQQQKQHHDHSQDDAHLKTLGECAKLCNQAAAHCLDQLRQGQGDKQHHAKAHELTMDCQAFCALTAALVARHSELTQYMHEACAEACRCCAEECEKSKDSQQIMQECARICRDCEKACREASKMASRSK